MWARTRKMSSSDTGIFLNSARLITLLLSAPQEKQRIQFLVNGTDLSFGPGDTPRANKMLHPHQDEKVRFLQKQSGDLGHGSGKLI
jgi:hypothetical protein